MRGLFNKVSNPLTLSQTLDCIAADTNYMKYVHIFMCNAGNKIVTWQLQNAMSNFRNFCKVCAQQKSKNKSGTFIYKFSRNLCFNS